MIERDSPPPTLSDVRLGLRCGVPRARLRWSQTEPTPGSPTATTSSR